MIRAAQILGLFFGWCAAGVGAHAGESVTLGVTNVGQTATFAIETKAEIAKIDVRENQLNISFDRPVEGDLLAPVAQAPAIFLGALHAERTSQLRYLVAPEYRISNVRTATGAIITATVDGMLGPVEFQVQLDAITPRVKPGKANNIEEPPLLMHAAMPMQAPPQRVEQFASALLQWRARTKAEGFLALEEQLQSALGAQESIDTVADLATFYAANGLFPEALTVSENFAPNQAVPALSFLQAFAMLNMRRTADADLAFDQAIAAGVPAEGWKTIALYRMGAMERAFQTMQTTAPDSVPFGANAPDFYIAKADLFLVNGNVSSARNALAQMRRLQLTATQRDTRRLIEAKIMTASGNDRAADALFGELSENASAPVNIKARTAHIKQMAARGEIAPADALRSLEELSLGWSGGQGGRALLTAQALMHDKLGDMIGAIAVRRQIIAEYPLSDGAKEAADYIRSALPVILADRRLSPQKAAEIFYENIDYAPPGAAGDALIRDAAQTLIRLDLLKEAAELMRHQVFKRLRGEERSRYGASLAMLYVDLGDGQQALQVLGATRRTRLSASIQRDRLLAEGKALKALGKANEALAVLADQSDPAIATLRGDIQWAEKDYKGAASSYQVALGVTDEVYSPREERLALSAAAAMRLADDKKGLAELSAMAMPKLATDDAKEILTAIVSEDFAHASADFMKNYKAYFAIDPSS